MRLQRYDVPVPMRELVLHRRTMIRGGLGLVMGAMVGGLQDSYDTYALPEPEPVPEPVQAAPEPEPEPVPPPPRTEWRRGDSGDDVRVLQEQLAANGYWCGTADGGFGHLTEQAVYAVQKAHGLSRDGICGPLTTGALATGYRPAAAAGGDHIEVHLGSQLLLVVRGGGTSMVLNTSTGNGEPYTFRGNDHVAVTPAGDFAIWYTDGSGWRDGELGKLYRPMFYDGDYAIHGSESIPPWPASHGCARVSTAFMDLVWSQGLLGMGGRVLVV
ncbi:L,D-transpeptidase family protein [Ornithinimicrobium sp. Y1847]|uniref:L,D-transpeptidase family protein n=1 Tax=Ornithinimicrobium sp. Y1847 TaxID=3405419 RepID=UPI003B678778